MPRRAVTRQGVDLAAAILPAAAALVSRRGTSGTTLAGLARDLGVSIRPVRNRYADTNALLVDTWHTLLWPPLQTRLTGLLAMLEAGDEQGLVDALQQSLDRGAGPDATAELLLHARFAPDLQQAMAATVGGLVTSVTSRGPTESARSAYLLALALGLMIGARHERARSLDLPAALPPWLAAAVHPATPQPLPEARAPHMDDYPVLAPGDPALDILLNTALEMISERGFDQVTVAQIARAAGFTEGLAFGRYPTKLAMLRDATKRQNDAGIALNDDFTAALRERHGAAIAEAVTLQQAQRPGRETGRSMALEQIRLGWHHRELAVAQRDSLNEFRAHLLTRPGWAEYESETDYFLQFALSWGIYFLPFLNGGVHTLPYDCVLVPLYDRFAERLDPRGSPS